MLQSELINKYQTVVETEGDFISRLLFMANRKILNDILNQFNHTYQQSLSFTQFTVLQMLCLKGINNTLLAERLTISKQAISQIIDDLVNLNLVQKEPDPADSRAKIVKHTTEGLKIVSQIIDASLRFEQELAQKIGMDNFKLLKSTLAELIDT